MAGKGKEQERCEHCGMELGVNEKLGIVHTGCVEIEYPPFPKQREWLGGGFSQTCIPEPESEKAPKIK